MKLMICELSGKNLIMLPLLSQGHWIFVIQDLRQGLVPYYDGVPDFHLSLVQQIAPLLVQVFMCHIRQVTRHTPVAPTTGDHCGAIVLNKLGLFLGLWTSMSEQALQSYPSQTGNGSYCSGNRTSKSLAGFQTTCQSATETIPLETRAEPAVAPQPHLLLLAHPFLQKTTRWNRSQLIASRRKEVEL